ncbi:hypothetical protein TNCV_1258251 [Trichonephila clavipes]|nr:hypothetical protein TNCV_1258251 [Trichonephila clavipes]
MSLNELEARLQKMWNEMSQDIIQNLYASTPNRIASCICARWCSTGEDLLAKCDRRAECQGCFVGVVVESLEELCDGASRYFFEC